MRKSTMHPPSLVGQLFKILPIVFVTFAILNLVVYFFSSPSSVSVDSPLEPATDELPNLLVSSQKKIANLEAQLALAGQRANAQLEAQLALASQRVKRVADLEAQLALANQHEADLNEPESVRAVASTLFDCTSLSSARVVKPLGYGVTKKAFLVTIGDDDRRFVFKRVQPETSDGRSRMGVYKLLKEAHILSVLAEETPEAMHVLGTCIFSEDADMTDFTDGLTTIYEWSSDGHLPTTPTPWIVFLRRLHNSSLGSIKITDVKRGQFRLLRGHINMIDMDDVFVDVARGRATVASNCRVVKERLSVRFDAKECVEMVLKK